MNISFSEFKDMEFPRTPDIVYVLYFRKSNDTSDIPFYVGESSRNIGRFGDYVSANFKAPTDFKVGAAIKYIRSLGFYIGIKYKETKRRKDEEENILNELRKHYLLLNDLKGFNYKSSNEVDEKLKIHEFMRKLIHGENDTKENIGTNTSNEGHSGESNENKADRIMNAQNIPAIIKSICEELGSNGKEIYRKDIIKRAEKYDIKEDSVLPADYCDNTRTGRWSKHTFLHSLGPGRYVLLRFKGK